MLAISLEAYDSLKHNVDPQLVDSCVPTVTVVAPKLTIPAAAALYLGDLKHHRN